jgi:very-short-patch-repair endonuclease
MASIAGRAIHRNENKMSIDSDRRAWTAALKHARSSPPFESPIEQAFWDEWIFHQIYLFMFEQIAIRLVLVPQYPILRYKVDFAHLDTHIAIELDGHASHSSPDAIAHDRKRQREIEALGWQFIRFGGKEIYTDVTACVREASRLIHRRIDELRQAEAQRILLERQARIEQDVRRNPVVQEVMKTFSARIVDVRPR